MVQAAWFAAITRNVTRTRIVKQHCVRDMDFIDVSDNPRPGHTGNNRFRKRRLPGLSERFVPIVHMASSAHGIVEKRKGHCPDDDAEPGNEADAIETKPGRC